MAPGLGTVLGCALPLIMSTYVGVAEAAADRALALAGRRADRPRDGARRRADARPAHQSRGTACGR